MERENLIKPIGIERLVDWAFSREKVARMAGLDRGIIPELTLLTKTTVTYGERIGGGGGMASYDIHPDAQAVYDSWLTLLTFSTDGAHLIRSYGETSMRPDWIPDGELRFEPVLDPATGLPKQVRDHNRHLVRDSCRIRKVGVDAGKVRGSRRDYLVWWAALHFLQALVEEEDEKRGGLVSWRLTGEMPPKEPWMIEGGGNGIFFEKAS